jgi:16S rRNA (guanine527-N7)-methyltransferase
VSIPIEIETILRKNDIILNDNQRQDLDSYVDLLSEWNLRVNLVSRRGDETIWKSHIVHSLSPLFMIEFPSGLRLLDLGTGGGLPGVPLQIVHGGMDVTLLDSIKKKTAAVQDIIRRARLSGLNAVNGRAEEIGLMQEYAGSFDLVVARAVAPLVDLVRWSTPFLRKRGLVSRQRRGAKSEIKFPYLLALKGGDLEREVADVRRNVRVSAITEIPLVFAGSEALDLVDKKIIIVEFP